MEYLSDFFSTLLKNFFLLLISDFVQIFYQPIILVIRYMLFKYFTDLKVNVLTLLESTIKHVDNT